MTTAVMNNGTMVVGERPRRSLEELVDRVMDALFVSNHEQPTAQTVARRVHDARRLRKAGEPGRSADGVRRAWTQVRRTRSEARWAYAEWQALARRQVSGRPGAAGLQPGHRQGGGARSPRRRDRESPGRAGDGVAAGQGGLREEPAGPEAPERRWVMVVANTQVDLAALKSRHSLADVVEACGRAAARPKGQSAPRRSAPSTRSRKAALRCTATPSRFHCFGCGVGGDVLDFIQRAEGLTLPEAIQRLGGGTGLAPSPAARPKVAGHRPRHGAPLLPWFPSGIRLRCRRQPGSTSGPCCAAVRGA